MGVKDLWQILSPTCERKSLWDLQGKTLAVDLSGWVCDSQNVAEYSSQPNMYLRNLFFRTSCLLLLGAYPVFVLEGTAPDMKHKVMAKRNALRGLSQASQGTKPKSCSGARRKYSSIQKQCQEMLQCMGVDCVQSAGEAEAFCALLNAKGMVDGCITQDSDCFLYGGRVVYRNFTISASSGGGGGPGFSVDVYSMDQVEKALGLSRTKLVGLSLLCGCDYNQAGVAGVGKETALKFILTLDDEDIFSRFQSWRDDPYYEHLEKERTLGTCDFCGHYGKRKQHEKEGCILCGTPTRCIQTVRNDGLSQKDPEERRLLVNELNIRKKALQDHSFPSQEVISEFLHTKERLPDKLQCEWKQPNLMKFLKLAERQLSWEESYSLEKFLPLLTRWLLLNHSKKHTSCPVFPQKISRARVLKGVASYEMRWADSAGLFETLLSNANDETNSDNLCVTIEPKELVEKAFPDLVLTYNEEQNAKKKPKKKGQGKSTKITKTASSFEKCLNCGKGNRNKRQKCMCEFIKISDKAEPKKPNSLEEYLDSLNLCGDTTEKLRSPESKLSEEKEGTENLDVHVGASKRLPLKITTRGKENLDTVCLQLQSLGSCSLTNLSSSNKSCDSRDSKMSFESLLNGEEWSVTDFVSDEEMDLSGVVQSIICGSTVKPTPCTRASGRSLKRTGKNTPPLSSKCGGMETVWKTPQLSNRQEEPKETSISSCGNLKAKPSFPAVFTERTRSRREEWGDENDSCDSLCEVPLSPGSSDLECERVRGKTPTDRRKISPLSSEDSADEDTPYTPLIDRVRLLRQEQARCNRRPSILSSPQAQRFSESFEIFLRESAPASSSPVLSDGDQDSSSAVQSDQDQDQDSRCSLDLPPQYFENARGKFSLGISKILESSK